MARDFVAASSQYLNIDSPVKTGAPFTAACWFRSDSTTAAQSLFWLGDKDATNHFWRMMARGDTAGDPVQFGKSAGGAVQTVNTSTGFSANTWHHACIVVSAANSYAVFIDGGSKGSDNTNSSPANADRTSIGRNGTSTPGSYMSGQIAEMGFWSVALTDAEVALLAKGFSPQMVRPMSLANYWPLVGRYSPEIDTVGGFDMVLGGSPGNANHPRIIYPRHRTIVDIAAAAAALVADGAAYDISGDIAALKLGALIAAITEAYSITGEAAALNKGLLLAVLSDSYSLSGTDAAILRNALSVGDSGSYDLAGVIADLLSAYVLPADLGTLLVAGTDAGLNYDPGEAPSSSIYPIIPRRRRRL